MKNSHGVTLIAVAISVTAAGWWAALNVAGLSSLMSRALDSGIELDVQVPPGNESSNAKTSYHPSHYLFFNGNQSYGVIPADRNLNTHQFSISFWVKNEGRNHHDFSRPIEMLQWVRNNQSGPSVPYGWAFDAGNLTRIGDGKIRFAVGSTSGHLYVTPSTGLSPGNWTHVVGVFDERELKLFKDGILVSKFPFADSYSYPIYPIPICLATGSVANQFWTGGLSDVQLYGRALSEGEVESIFNSRGEGRVPAGLIGRWELDEGIGDSIRDSTGNRNNGTLSNRMWR